MLSQKNEKFIAKLLSVGLLITTVFVLTGSVTDPVNATKLFTLGVFSVAVFIPLAMKGTVARRVESKIVIVASLILVAAMLIAISFSGSPLVQNIYGTYGRNTGFLAYLFLLLIFVSTACLRERSSFQFIAASLLIAGGVNFLYGVWVEFFGDPINWNNPYGNLLGTFGNPNFISAFFGIVIGVLVGAILESKIHRLSRLGIFIVILVLMYLLGKTNSIQGYVVAGATSSLSVLIAVYIKGNKIVTRATISTLGLGGGVVALGLFNLGPLSGFLYQGTLAFREQYWKAAINMAQSSPFTGVGMDSFGDNYRAFRGAEALVSPGSNVVTNSAHNVPLDLLASGGIPLFIAYSTLVIFSLFSAIKVIKRLKNYDFIFVAIFVACFGYHLQSLISINQIGLAIWGWSLSGALIAFEISTRTSRSDTSTGKTAKGKEMNSMDEFISTKLLSGLGLVVGAMIAVPALSSDMAFANSTKLGNFAEVEKALQPSYLHPESSAKYLQMVQLLETSNLKPQAYKYALKGVEFNPNNFDAWYALYFVSDTTQIDKDLALANMKRLDPLNSEVLKR